LIFSVAKMPYTIRNVRRAMIADDSIVDSRLR
jgi:hypothetical protein